MKILIVRVSSLGDVVHNMPMVADIRHHYPDAHIDWVVEEAYADLVRLNPHVREIIPIALRRWRKSLVSTATRTEIAGFYRRLRREAYDFVFDTQGLLKTGAVMRMARLMPAGMRAGLANATEGSGYEALSRIFHDRSIPADLHMHAVTRARTVAAATLGYTLDDAVDFALQEPASMPTPAWLSRQAYAVFFHGTARAAKQWDRNNWVVVAQALAERGLPVWLPWGSAAEKQAAEDLAARMPQATVLPALSLMEAVTLARHAALVVGLDTGLTHIAAAYCRPTVELYCDSPRWKTEGNWSPRIANLGECGAPPDAVQVLLAIDRVLSAPLTQDDEA
ncbi:MAG TPA: lipopolysaccharide heptosyltransferase I [Herbaspirillum sp.]|nr:lipopolysaccharide heptosyltransferase I [Herbaspirillum sp.]